MERAMIGAIPLYDFAKSSYWMLPGYLEGLMEAGGLPVVLPLTADGAMLTQIADQCSGFLFTGGQDVTPEIYGAAALPCCGERCPARDEMEQALLPLILERDKPLLGICRGIQILNAALGGTLYQDLPEQHPSEVTHRQAPPYDLPAHEVELTADSPLRELLGKERLAVNSCHHQAIRTLAPGLRAMAYAGDGLVEAVCAPDYRWVWAVQWHPEFSFRRDADSRKLFRAFVAAAEGRASGEHGEESA